MSDDPLLVVFDLDAVTPENFFTGEWHLLTLGGMSGTGYEPGGFYYTVENARRWALGRAIGLGHSDTADIRADENVVIFRADCDSDLSANDLQELMAFRFRYLSRERRLGSIGSFTAVVPDISGDYQTHGLELVFVPAY